MTALVTKNFNGAGATTPLQTFDSSFTVLAGGIDVYTAGHIRGHTAGTDSLLYHNATTPDANQYSQIAVTVSGVGDWSGVACRCQVGAFTCYELQLFDRSGGNVSYSLDRCNAGSFTNKASGTVAWTNGDILKLVAIGVGSTVTLRMYKNGVQFGSDILDTDAGRITTAGRVGIPAYDGTTNTAQADNFEGGNYEAVITMVGLSSGAVYGSHTLNKVTPAYSASDNFNAGSGMPLATWNANWTVTRGAMEVTAGNVARGATGATSIAAWNAVTYNPNQGSQVKVTVTGSGDTGGVSVRDDLAAHTGYLWNFSNRVGGNVDYTLFRVVTDTFTDLKSATIAMADGDLMKLTARTVGGTVTLAMFKNGVQFDSVDDSDATRILAGNPGISGFGGGGTVTLDDWTGFELDDIIQGAVLPSGLASFAVFGTLTAADVVLSVAPAGLSSAAVYGSLIVGGPAQAISVPGKASNAVYGNQTLAKATPKSLAPSGLASSAVFGVHQISSAPLTSAGVPSAAVYGSALVSSGGVKLIQPAGKSSAAVFGTQTFSKLTAGTISPAGKSSAAAYGTITIADIQLKAIIPGLAAPYRYGSHRFIGGTPAPAEGQRKMWRTMWQA